MTIMPSLLFYGNKMLFEVHLVMRYEQFGDEGRCVLDYAVASCKSYTTAKLAESASASFI